MRTHLQISGRVSILERYSYQHPNVKLRGVPRFQYDLGHNLVLSRGRYIAAGLLLGTSGDLGLGVDGSDGWVVRGIALGESGQPASLDDTDLFLPFVNPNTGHHYHVFSSSFRAPFPETYITLTRVFGLDEPLPPGEGISVREFGLYTAAPGPSPPETTPTGPVGGPFLLARLVSDEAFIKTNDLAWEIRWTLQF